MSKRIIARLLTLAMVLSMLPGQALAEEIAPPRRHI